MTRPEVFNFNPVKKRDLSLKGWGWGRGKAALPRVTGKGLCSRGWDQGKFLCYWDHAEVAEVGRLHSPFGWRPGRFGSREPPTSAQQSAWKGGHPKFPFPSSSSPRPREPPSPHCRRSLA